MAAPTPSARIAPTGRKLGDGYQTLVAVASDTNMSFWENSITPPGLMADPPVDTTSMLNTRYHTFSPGTLITMTEFQMTGFYDPALYSSIVTIINVPTTITVHFPDGSSVCFYGYVKDFKPNALERGKPPDATITVQPTNQDPTTCNEEDPVYTAGSGTASSC